MICLSKCSACHQWLGCFYFQLNFKENGLSSNPTVIDALFCCSYHWRSPFFFLFSLFSSFGPFLLMMIFNNSNYQELFFTSSALIWFITQRYVHRQLRVSRAVSTANLEASITSKLRRLKSFWYQQNRQHLKKGKWKHFPHPILGNLSFPFPSLHAHTSFIFKSAGTVVQFSSLW